MATATMSAGAATPSSASAPEIHSRHTMASSGLIPSSSLDAILASSSRNTSPGSPPLCTSPKSVDQQSSGSNDSSTEPDAQIIEALRSKDRLYVLKLGEQMETLIQDQGYVSCSRLFDLGCVAVRRSRIPHVRLLCSRM